MLTISKHLLYLSILFFIILLMQIHYYTKNVYGSVLNYPVGDNGHSIQALIGKKTLSSYELSLLNSLGFELVRVFEPIN